VNDNYYRPAGFGGFSFFPPVIKNLIIINVIVFVIQTLGGGINTGNGLTLSDLITKYFALIPLSGLPLTNGLGQVVVHWSFYPWQLISYQFMHGGIAHIFFNMFALWMFGIEIENIWGSRKFLIFYLMCGVVAGIFQLVLPPLFGEALAPTIGASGAIFGVLVAFGMMFPNRYIFLYFFIPIKAKYLITGFILMEMFFIDQGGGNIAHLAHLGGALAGFIYIMLDTKTNVSLNSIFRRNTMRSGNNLFDSFKQKTVNTFKKKEGNIEEAKFYEIKDENDNDNKDEISQEEIDKILDKISRSGYQNLTAREKKILFEASKRMK
jgi:rhomboid family protein